MFGRNLDAHAPSDSETEANTHNATTTLLATLARRVPTDDSSHQCLQGKECYVESLLFTIAACSLALALSIYAGWKDYSSTKHAPRGRTPAVEVVWEDAEE